MRYFTNSNRLDTALSTVFMLALGLLTLLPVIGPLLQRAKEPVITGCGTDDLQSQIDDLLETKKRFIAVVGDGVPAQSLVVERPYNTQFAQGYDLYQGVRHALRSPDLAASQQSVGVLYVDDGGNPACAATIAETLAAQPRLLGVIGHSTTSCTKEALPFYSRSNIPLLIPAATNPALLQHRPRHTFRLPSNDMVQSLVIADLIETKLRAASVFIVWDATAEAVAYSEYLKTTIQHYLSLDRQPGSDAPRPPVIEGSYPISLNPLNYSYLFRRIISSDASVVVFAGYGSLAREFLLGLDHEYRQEGTKPRPTIILTDGCKIPGINPYGFTTYLTFAAAPLSEFKTFEGFNAGVELDRFRRMYLEESFEVFGYDAAVLLLTSIDQLLRTDKSVSRQQVIDFMATDSRRAKTSYPYAFENGENTKHRYYCYSLASNSIAYRYDEEAINALFSDMGARQ